MALGQIDFSPLRRAGAAGMEVAKSYDPLGSFTKGALKGIELGQSFQKMKMEGQELEMKKEDHKRRGTLNDLLITEAEGKIKKLDAELEDLPAKREHEKEIQEYELSKAKSEVERQKILLEKEKLLVDKAKKDLEVIGDVTTHDFESASSLATNILAAIDRAPNDYARGIIIDNANITIKSHPLLAAQFPNKITDDENGREILRYSAELFGDHAKSMRDRTREINPDTGDLEGYDKNGEWGVIKTEEELNKVAYNPKPSTNQKHIEDNRRRVSAQLDRLQKDSGIDYEIPGWSTRQIQDAVTAQYLGILAEEKRLNAPSRSDAERVDEAFSRAFNDNKFTIKELPNGRKIATYNPNAPAVSGYLKKDGQSLDVNLMGKDDKGNYVFQAGNGRKIVLTQAQYDTYFVQGK